MNSPIPSTLTGSRAYCSNHLRSWFIASSGDSPTEKWRVPLPSAMKETLPISSSPKSTSALPPFFMVMVSLTMEAFTMGVKAATPTGTTSSIIAPGYFSRDEYMGSDSIRFQFFPSSEEDHPSTEGTITEGTPPSVTTLKTISRPTL